MRWSACLRFHLISLLCLENFALEREAKKIGSFDEASISGSLEIINGVQNATQSPNGTMEEDRFPERESVSTDAVEADENVSPQMYLNETTFVNDTNPIDDELHENDSLSVNHTLPINDTSSHDVTSEPILEPVLKEIKSEYDFIEPNISFNEPEPTFFPSLSNESLSLSGSTVSWLEAFMFYYRNALWTTFNIIFMLIWVLVGFFSLYRLFGLPSCSTLLSRTFYLIVHLMIFTASTFSVVHLLHLCFGSHEGLPLFLTLLLTHTPVPCLASCCILIAYCIFLSARVPICGRYLPSFANLSVFITSLIVTSLLGDIIVGVTHSSIALIIFRGSINCLYIGTFIVFFFRHRKILQVSRLLRREFSGELKSLVIPLNTPNRDYNLDIRNKLKDILVIWSSLILASCVTATIMCISSLFLSLFFTVSYVPLWMFWVLHTVLFLSQITLIISLTLAAALTLMHTNRANILTKYFVLAFPSNDNRCDSFIKHGNFIYQRVSFSNMPPTCSNNDEPPNMKNNQIVIEPPFESRPKVNLRRSVTFNCGPKVEPLPYYSKNRMAPILSESCIPCSNLEICQCNFKELNTRYGSNCLSHHRTSRCYDHDEKETPYVYSGKYPRKNYYGRGKFNSSAPVKNGDVEIESALKTIKLNVIPLNQIAPSPNAPVTRVSQPKTEVQTKVLPSDKDCVKDIILENRELFNPLLRKHSLRSQQRSPSTPRALTHSNPTSPIRNRRQAENFLPKPPPPPLPVVNKVIAKRYDAIIPLQKLPEKVLISSLQSTSKEAAPAASIEVYPSVNEEKHIKQTAEPTTVDAHLNNSDNKEFEADSVSTNNNENIDTQKRAEDATITSNHIPKTPNSDYDSFTLPSPKRHSLKRNHSSAGDFVSSAHDEIVDPDRRSNASLSSSSSSKLKYPWYGTWSGRRAKKRSEDAPENALNGGGGALNRLSGSRGSLSSLYGRLKPKRVKSAVVHQAEQIDLEGQIAADSEDPPPVEQEEVVVEPEETLPNISDEIDLASEIFKSSRLLANFYALEKVNEVDDNNIDDEGDSQQIDLDGGNSSMNFISENQGLNTHHLSTSISNSNEVT